MSSPLIIKAGRTALRTIQLHGLRQQDVDLMIGASGGPKWFCLFGLDQYLCGEFFQHRQQPLELLGSSAGAWRFACYAQTDPVAASRRFCDAYRTLCYPKTADIEQVTAISATVMDAVFPDQASLQQVVDNPIFRLHFVVAKSRKVAAGRSKLAQLSALTLTAAANLLQRKNLKYFYQRLLFEQSAASDVFRGLGDLPTTHIALTTANLKSALLATGAIPLVIEPVRHIEGAGHGHFVDGGILDYHFDWQFPTTGLILYPHFYPHLSPGWFDKSLRWRHAKGPHLQQLVLLCPSQSWIQSLPFGKIPDRTDFQKMSDPERLSYWQEVTERSFELADAFKQGRYELQALEEK